MPGSSLLLKGDTGEIIHRKFLYKTERIWYF